MVTGYLVCLCRLASLLSKPDCAAKNANHTFMMNFMVYGWGFQFAFWVMGFAIQPGGSAGNTNLGGAKSLKLEFTLNFMAGNRGDCLGREAFF